MELSEEREELFLYLDYHLAHVNAAPVKVSFRFYYIGKINVSGVQILEHAFDVSICLVSFIPLEPNVSSDLPMFPRTSLQD